MKIMAAVKALYAKEGGAHPAPILNLKWDYTDAEGRYDALKVSKQINGYFLKDTVVDDKGVKTLYKKGQTVPTFGMLQADGSTASGNWIMAGSFDAKGLNKMALRGKDDPTGLGLYPNWSYVWPLNRRIIYNRASCDLNGETLQSKAQAFGVDGRQMGGRRAGRPLAADGGQGKGKVSLHHEDGRPGRHLRAWYGRRTLPRNIMSHWRDP